MKVFELSNMDTRLRVPNVNSWAVSWYRRVTIPLLFILSVHMNLSTMQVDYTSIFLHAELNDKEYDDTLCDFKQDGKILKL